MKPGSLSPLRKLLVAAVFAAGIYSLLASNTGPTGTSLPAETGDINVTIVRAVATVGQLCPITSVNWAVAPVAVPPRPSGSTVATTAPAPVWKNYSGGTGSTSGGTAQFPIVCVHTDTLTPFAAGTWSVTGKAVKGNAFTCNKVVPAGGNVSGKWIFNEGGTAESCS